MHLQHSERLQASPWVRRTVHAESFTTSKPVKKSSPVPSVPRPDPHLLSKVRRKPLPSPENSKIFRETDSFHPVHTIKSPFTRRISWSRRISESAKPLLILNWEGVIGQWYRPGYAESYEVYMRQGWEQGVKMMMEMFLVVLLTSLSSEKLTRLTDIFTSKSITFDAVYKIRKSDGTSFLLDYSQIISDFGFQTETDSILIVSSLGIDQEDLKIRSEIDLIQEFSTSRHRRFLCHCCPINVPNPVCLLVPNFIAQAGYVSARMDFIAKVIGDWLQFDCSLRRNQVNFREIFGKMKGKYGVKKVEIGVEVMKSYREEVNGVERCYSRSSIEEEGEVVRIVVLTDVGKPAGVAMPYTEARKAGDRRLERKLSTKSLL